MAVAFQGVSSKCRVGCIRSDSVSGKMPPAKGICLETGCCPSRAVELDFEGFRAMAGNALPILRVRGQSSTRVKQSWRIGGTNGWATFDHDLGRCTRIRRFRPCCDSAHYLSSSRKSKNSCTEWAVQSNSIFSRLNRHLLFTTDHNSLGCAPFSSPLDFVSRSRLLPTLRGSHGIQHSVLRQFDRNGRIEPMGAVGEVTYSTNLNLSALPAEITRLGLKMRAVKRPA